MANAALIIPLLMQTDLFGGLDKVYVEACAAVFHEIRFGKGETLFARGEMSSRLYLIAEGRVRLAVMTDEGRELSFRHATAGSLIGEIAALDGEPRSADAQALSDVLAYSLERNALTELCAAHPAILTALVRFLCRRVRDTSSQLEAIALYPIETRLARFLLLALGDRKAEAGKRIPLDLGFSQSELAQLLGASRPKVNAALGWLEEMNAIKRTIDRVFCDPAKLAQIAHGDNV
jgi:CRP/FNR family transcriptional regulator, cyclic AMP receptor protein